MTNGGFCLYNSSNIRNYFSQTDPAGNIKPDKEKSTERIDGAVALVMALDRAIRNENRANVYDGKGIIFV
jgi:phage terminase large subunit-like protein